jgi:translation elongation factor EF-Ts
MLGKRFFAAKGGALLDQAYIYETNKNVAQALDEAGIEVVDFVRASVTE